MLRMEELLEKLESEYPDTATALIGKSDYDITIYLAKIELINHIKMLNETKKRKDK